MGFIQRLTDMLREVFLGEMATEGRAIAATLREVNQKLRQEFGLDEKPPLVIEANGHAPALPVEEPATKRRAGAKR